jgi:hypothetical protein
VHAIREGAFGSLDGQVEVICHQDPVMQNPPEALDGCGKEREELQVIALLVEDGDAVVTPRHHVMKGARSLESQRSGHTDRGYLGVNARPRNPQQDGEKLLGMERNEENFYLA